MILVLNDRVCELTGVLDEQVGWDKARFDQIVQSLTTFLQSSGFRLKNLWFVPLSGLTGANLEKKVDASECAWYSGPSLVDAIGTALPVCTAATRGPIDHSH